MTIANLHAVYESSPSAVGSGAPTKILTDAYGNLKTSPVVAVGGGVTWTDRTKTSLAGTSETLAAALATRKALLIQNTGASNVGVNLTGGTAAVGGAATLTLESLAILSLSGAECPVGAVTVIGGAGQPLFCLEGA